EPVVERAVIRIVGEALRNVAQHAGAQKAKVALQYGSEGVVVTIEDDGRGFDIDQTFATSEGRGHFGVVGMRERAEAAGGQLVVRSEPGHGTIVRANIPYATLATVPGAASGPIEDTDQTGVEDQDTSDRGGFFARLFGRREISTRSAACACSSRTTTPSCAAAFVRSSRPKTTSRSWAKRPTAIRRSSLLRSCC